MFEKVDGLILIETIAGILVALIRILGHSGILLIHAPLIRTTVVKDALKLSLLNSFLIILSTSRYDW